MEAGPYDVFYVSLRHFVIRSSKIFCHFDVVFLLIFHSYNMLYPLQTRFKVK